jgi:hypothetical protein
MSFVLILLMPFEIVMATDNDNPTGHRVIDTVSDDSAMGAQKAAKEYALRFGESGTAENTAALRRAYAIMSRGTGETGNMDDGIRALGDIAKAETEPRLDQPPGLIDKDPATAASLLELLPVEHRGDLELRVTDPTKMINKFQEAVALWSHETFGCSGVLIGPKEVVTAAHCVCLGVTKIAGFGYDPGVSMQTRRVVSARVPQGVACKSEESRKGRDIALLILNEEPAENWQVQPAILAQPSNLSPEIFKKGITVVGFGSTIPGGNDRVGQRNGTLVPIVSARCDRADDAKYGCRKDAEAVALSPRAGKSGDRPDACYGDSGGPAYIYTGEGEFRVLAVVSRGILGEKVCGEGSIYSLITPDRLEDLRMNGVEIK